MADANKTQQITFDDQRCAGDDKGWLNIHDEEFIKDVEKSYQSFKVFAGDNDRCWANIQIKSKLESRILEEMIEDYFAEGNPKDKKILETWLKKALKAEDVKVTDASRELHLTNIFI